MQERQNRVCTTVAIAIVAETCSPFTVLPALMNEYRVPELNVQNGVLKSLSFLFEYIGEMGKDYIYAVTPLLEDALMDRYQPCFIFEFAYSYLPALKLVSLFMCNSQIKSHQNNVFILFPGTSSIAKQHVQPSNTWLWESMALVVKMPSFIY